MARFILISPTVPDALNETSEFSTAGILRVYIASIGNNFATSLRLSEASRARLSEPEGSRASAASDAEASSVACDSGVCNAKSFAVIATESITNSPEMESMAKPERSTAAIFSIGTRSAVPRL